MAELTTFAELAEIIDRAPDILRDARRARGLSLRAAASEVGVSFSTLTRFESGEDCVVSTLTALMRWVDATPSDASGADR